jgi:hypothetical protein
LARNQGDQDGEEENVSGDENHHAGIIGQRSEER